MPHRALADLVVVVHLAFIVFVVTGGFLALRWRWIAWLHLPAALWGAALELGGWICPLTPLEQWLRRAGGATAYTGGFVDHYIVPLVYPAGLTRPTQLVLGGAVVAINLAAYALVLRQRSRERSGPAT